MRPGRLDNAITWSKELAPDALQKMIAGHRLYPMGETLKPINESSPELADPERVVLHVPTGVEFAGADRPGYHVVAPTCIHHSCVFRMTTVPCPAVMRGREARREPMIWTTRLYIAGSQFSVCLFCHRAA